MLGCFHLSLVFLAQQFQQKKRLHQTYKKAKVKTKTNAELSSKDLVKHLKLSPEVKDMLNESAKKLDLSARSYHRIIKLARTIADMETSHEIKVDHILEALQYRPKRYSTV